MKNLKKKVLCIGLTCMMGIGAINIKPVGAIDYLGLAASALWSIAKYANQAFFYRAPSIKRGDYYVQSGTGSVDFNNTVGSSVFIPVNLGHSKLELDAFAQNGAIFSWIDKIVVTLVNPNGGLIYSKSVTHNQHSFYKPSSSFGKYTLQFTEEDRFKWDCYYVLYDDSVTRTSTAAKYQTVYNSEGTTIDSVYNSENQKSYIISKNNSNVKPRSAKTPLNAEQLQSQVYDKTRKVSTNDLIDYQVNDSLYLNDYITEIEYNSEGNYTLFSLGSGETTLHWPFSGDLTSQYKVGDNLKLKLKVVEEYSYDNHVFENLNYCLEGLELEKQGLYPNIKDYLQ